MKLPSARKRQQGSADIGLILKVVFAGILLSAVVGIQGWIKHHRMKRDGYVEVTEISDDTGAETFSDPPTYLTY